MNESQKYVGREKPHTEVGHKVQFPLLVYAAHTQANALREKSQNSSSLWEIVTKRGLTRAFWGASNVLDLDGGYTPSFAHKNSQAMVYTYNVYTWLYMSFSITRDKQKTEGEWMCVLWHIFILRMFFFLIKALKHWISYITFFCRPPKSILRQSSPFSLMARLLKALLVHMQEPCTCSSHDDL